MTDPGLTEEYRGILEAAGVAIHLAPLAEAGNLNGSSISEPLRTVTMRAEA